MTLTDFNSIWFAALAVGAVGLAYALATAAAIRRQEPGNDRMQEIAAAIRTGAMAFLNREYRVLAVFVAVVFVLLYVFLTSRLAISFISGAFLSVLAGNLGMRIATLANSRTAWAVKRELNAVPSPCMATHLERPERSRR